MITTRIEAWRSVVAARPDVRSDVKNYLDKIGDIKTIDAFLKDDRVFRVAMKAFGLGDMAYAKGFMRKVLAEGVDSPDAFANKLADRRYREFAATFNFNRYGETTTIFDRTRQGTVDGYLRQMLEETAGAGNENVRLALYFERMAPGISSPFDILSDRALTQVVYTALGLPGATSLMNIDAQAALISKRLDIADFQTPGKMSRFVTRFAALADSQSGAATSPAAGLLDTGARRGFGIDLLMAMQAARFGGAR